MSQTVETSTGDHQNQPRKKFILFVGKFYFDALNLFHCLESIYFGLIGNLTFDTTEDDLKKFFEDTSTDIEFIHVQVITTFL